MDYTLPGEMSFDIGSGDEDILVFEVTVNADNMVESDETIVLNVVESLKTNVVLINNQTTVIVTDQNSKFVCNA